MYETAIRKAQRHVLRPRPNRNIKGLMMSAENHNDALFPALKIITEASANEAGQWVIIESLCLGVGKLHGRNDRQTAEFVETIANRIASGQRK